MKQAPIPARPGYVRHGNGPERVTVLHDWLGDHRNYDAVLPYLDGSAFTYVFADLRGYGESIALTGACSVEEIAADCLALADRLGWPRFHLIGHSMTGMAVQRIAADAPARIQRAVAVCPVSAAGNRLDADAKAFFASTAENDDALRRLFRYVSGGCLRGGPTSSCSRTAARSRQPAAPAISTCWCIRISSTMCAASISNCW